MGMIQSIRNRQTLLLAVIGLGMLSIILGDLARSLSDPAAGNQIAGMVNGEEISRQEYNIKVQQRNKLVTYADKSVAQTQVWNDIVSERLLGDEFSDLGLEVTNEEYEDIRYGDYVSNFSAQIFYGGQVTEEQKNVVRQRFNAWFNDPAQRETYYNGFADLITFQRMREKMQGLVNGAIAANTLEGKREFLRTEETVDFRYVLKRYTSTPDEEVEVTDNDIEAYYAAHKDDAEYAQRAGRDVEYIRILGPDSTVKCRHILLKTDDLNDADQLAALEARADSIQRRLEAGDAFADLLIRLIVLPALDVLAAVDAARCVWMCF